LELDVHATGDDEIIVLHDPTLERTTNGTGPVVRHTLAELQRLDAGYNFRAPDGGYPYRGHGVRVPTLAEVLEAFPGVPVNIELKPRTPRVEHLAVAVLDRFNARERTLLAAEHADIMARIRAAAPEMLTSFAAAEVADFLSRVHGGDWHDYRPPGVALQVPPQYEGTEIVSRASVEAAHRLGLEVHVWTINDEAEMERLLDLGVDALMTDFPLRATAVLRRRGLR